MDLSKPKIEHVQLLWTDLSNITRCRGMKIDMLKSLEITGSSICGGIMSMPHTKDVCLENHVGEIRIVPDLESMIKAPWYERNNTSLCFAYLRQSNGSPWNYCPRQFLQTQSKKLEFPINLGFELEFYIFHKSTGHPVDTTVAFEVKSLRGIYWKILTDIVETVEKLKIPVFSYHSESGHGQYEVSIGPFWGSEMSLVQMGDALVLARQTIYNVVESYDDLFATFVAKPIQGQCGSGCHMHISIVNSETSILESFIAGVYEHLPLLLPILAPTANSYERIKPGAWSGGYHCIGTENKEAPIRLIRNAENGALERFEIKTPDGTSNPYMMIGTIIGAGYDGIEKKLPLPLEINIDPSFIPEETRPKLMPQSLSAALKLFENNKFIHDLLGKDVCDLVQKIRHVELGYLESLPNQESRIKFLMSRY